MIAVIAILAAVLIPTFTSLIRKANLSADKASVRDMNTALVSDEILNGKPASVLDAMLRMEENGYSFENYKPLSDDCMFLWHKDTNRILLVKVTDGGYSVEFPEGYEEIEINDSLIGPSNAFQTLYLVDIGTDKESVESLLSGEDAVVVDQNGAPAQRALENATEASLSPSI